MSSENKAIVAYFDFDGTLTRHDTFLYFLKYVLGPVKFFIKLPLLLPTGMLYLLRIINNESAKERTLTIMARGLSYKLMQIKAERFAKTKLAEFLQPEIYARLEYHIEHGHTVILVSANLAIYLRYFVKNHHIHDVIATEIEFKDDLCTGKLATRNCYGRQKTLRIAEYLKEGNKTFSYIYAYGNSRGDYELLHYANEAYWISGATIRPFKSN